MRLIKGGVGAYGRIFWVPIQDGKWVKIEIWASGSGNLGIPLVVKSSTIFQRETPNTEHGVRVYEEIPAPN